MPHDTAVAPLRPDQEHLCEQVAALVNEVYAATEGPMWRPGGQRTSVDEVRTLAAAGQLHAHVADTPDGQQVRGSVWTVVHGGRAELGMLAVRPDAGGRGLGGALVAYAEDLAREAGAAVMELVVARPREGTLPAKERLGVWYPRLGYQLVRTDPLAEVYPDLLEAFVVPVVIDVYERAL